MNSHKLSPDEWLRRYHREYTLGYRVFPQESPMRMQDQMWEIIDLSHVGKGESAPSDFARQHIINDIESERYCPSLCVMAIGALFGFVWFCGLYQIGCWIARAL